MLFVAIIVHVGFFLFTLSGHEHMKNNKVVHCLMLKDLYINSP